VLVLVLKRVAYDFSCPVVQYIGQSAHDVTGMLLRRCFFLPYCRHNNVQKQRRFNVECRLSQHVVTVKTVLYFYSFYVMFSFFSTMLHTVDFVRNGIEIIQESRSKLSWYIPSCCTNQQQRERIKVNFL